MNTPAISLKGLPYVPLDPQWLVESDAFHSGDARVVRAGFHMLKHAWAATPAGSIPSDFQGIARVSGLDEIAVGEHYEALTAGWELRDGRLHHVRMSELAVRIAAAHGDSLQKLADQSAALIQAPELFTLTCSEPTSRTKGRHLLPSTFALTDQRRAWMANSVIKITDEADQDYVFQLFRSWALRSNEKYNDWEMTFENFVLKQNLRNLPSRQAPVFQAVPGAGGRLSRYGSRGVQTECHNKSVMETTRARSNG